eukprot:844160-Rhodomonas_salina.3
MEAELKLAGAKLPVSVSTLSPCTSPPPALEAWYAVFSSGHRYRASRREIARRTLSQYCALGRGIAGFCTRVQCGKCRRGCLRRKLVGRARGLVADTRRLSTSTHRGSTKVRHQYKACP